MNSFIGIIYMRHKFFYLSMKLQNDNNCTYFNFVGNPVSIRIRGKHGCHCRINRFSWLDSLYSTRLEHRRFVISIEYPDPHIS